MDYNVVDRKEWSGHLRYIRVCNGLEPEIPDPSVEEDEEEAELNGDAAPEVSMGGVEIQESQVGIGSPTLENEIMQGAALREEEILQKMGLFDAARTLGELQDAHLLSSTLFTPRPEKPAELDLGGEGDGVTSLGVIACARRVEELAVSKQRVDRVKARFGSPLITDEVRLAAWPGPRLSTGV